MVARALRDGQVLTEAPLSYAGKKSTFAGQVVLDSKGPAELEVLAMDPSNANFGLARRTVVVGP